MKKDLKTIEELHFNVNSILDNILMIQNKLDNTNKFKQPLFLELCKLEKQLTKINILKFDTIDKLNNNK